eukprot:10745244-Alexandrium_andersonii.AAC.1
MLGLQDASPLFSAASSATRLRRSALPYGPTATSSSLNCWRWSHCAGATVGARTCSRSCAS